MSPRDFKTQVFTLVAFSGALIALKSPGTGFAGDKKNKAAPTKKDAVRVLRDFRQALHSKDFDKALAFIYLPEKFKNERAKLKEGFQELSNPKLLDAELGEKGIARLEGKGQWGKLVDWLDEFDVTRITKEREISPADCYALYLEKGSRRGAAFIQREGRLLIVYFNNIGHIE